METFNSNLKPCLVNGHRPCGSTDITYLTCHMTLQDHVISGSIDFMEEGSLLYVTNLPSLVAVALVVMEI